MLQDGIFVRGDWIKGKANQAIAVKFLEATFKGWAFCRDNYKACVNIVARRRPALPHGHQTWQMNEVNALIWPNKLGHRRHEPGRLREDGEDLQEVQGDQEAGDEGAFRSDLAKKAVAILKQAGRRRLRQEYKKAVVVDRRRQVTARRGLVDPREAGSAAAAPDRRLRPARSSPSEGGEMTCRH